MQPPDCGFSGDSVFLLHKCVFEFYYEIALVFYCFKTGPKLIRGGKDSGWKGVLVLGELQAFGFTDDGVLLIPSLQHILLENDAVGLLLVLLLQIGEDVNCGQSSPCDHTEYFCYILLLDEKESLLE